MGEQLLEMWRTIVPDRDGRHGPLPPFLLLLTLVTGLVDAFSYLLLGRVFVANMTGNVVFLAFSLAGAPGFSVWASALALLAFAGGAFAGGAVVSRRADHRGRLARFAFTLEAVFIVVATVVAYVAGDTIGTPERAVLIVLVGSGMGLQNATARALGVPDLTTTVLTLTITGITADSRLAGGTGSHVGRRLLSAATMFLGALIGVLAVRHAAPGTPLLVAAAALVGISLAATRLAASRGAWVTRS